MGVNEIKDIGVDKKVISKEEHVPPSSEDNLCRILTGISYEEDPEGVINKMISDRNEIYKKYGIPLSGEYKDSREYAKVLLDMAKNSDIPVSLVDPIALKKHGVGAGITQQGKIVASTIDLNSCTDIEAYNWAVKFGHELIHAVQQKHDPSIPIEQAEYEAYILTYLPTAYDNSVKDYPGMETVQYYMVDSYMFEKIKGSCLGYYEKNGITQDKIPWVVSNKIESKNVVELIDDR